MPLAVANALKLPSGLVSSGGAAPPAFTLNWNPTVNLANWRTKRAAVIAGTARATIVSVGESTSTGVGAGTGGIGIVDGWNKAWPNRLAVKLAAGGIPATTSSFFNGAGGGNLTFSTLASYDPRRTFGAGWDNYVPTPPMGWFGGNYLYSQGASNNIDFAPGTSFDTIKVHDFSGGVPGTLTVAIDGGANLSPTLPQSGGSAYRITSYTVALGVHTVNLRGLNTSETVLGGCQVFNSAVKAVDVIIGGIPSGNVLQSSDTSDPWSAGNVTGALQPDLLIIKTAINDALDLTTMAAFKAGLQVLVDKGKLTGDVVMLTSNPWSGSTQQVQEDLRTAMIEVANTNGLLVIDGFNFYGGTWAIANANGLMFDQYHPNATGYDNEAQLIYNILMAA
jgi:hypothetical protein